MFCSIKNKRLKSLLMLVGLSLTSQASALDLQGYKFTDSYRYAYLDDGGQEHFDHPLVLETSYTHIKSPLYVTDLRFNNFIEEVIKKYDIFTIGGSYRFSDYFTFGLESSFVNAKLKDGSQSHLGDTHLKGKILLIKTDSQSITLLPEFILPTGAEYSFTTRKSLSGSLKLAYEKHAGDFHLLASAGYSHSPKNIYSIINYRNLLLTELGLSYDLTQKLNINLELNRNFTLATDYRQDEGDYYLTLKHKTFENLSIYGGAGISGFSTLDRKNWTTFVGLKFDFGSDKNEERKSLPVAIAPTKVEHVPSAQPAIIKSAADEKKLYGEVFAAENIYFGNAQTSIRESEQLKIDSLVTKISKHRVNIKQIVIEGYASKTGNAKKNQMLSLKRAEEVRLALINSGIEESLTSVVAYGDRALVQDKDEEKNRKVQFRIYLQK